MYWALRLYSITPGQIMAMGINERKVFYAFVRYDLEQRAKESEQAGGE